MSEIRVPQRGLPKPPPKRYPVTVATYTNEEIERSDNMGRYRLWWSRQNRYCQKVQVGAAAYCVVDNFGFLVPLEWELEAR